MVSHDNRSERSILVADDEELFLESTADILREEGYHCDTVTNSTDGRAALDRGRYDLLIADINMPGNANLEFVGRGRESFPSLPVILMTGYPEVETAVKGIEIGIDDYVLKPFEEQSFIQKVKKAIGHKPAPRNLKCRNGHQFTPLNRVVESKGRTLEISTKGIADFAGGVAHDLDNMLNIVDGYLHLSQQSINPDHIVQRYFAESRSAIKDAVKFTQGLIEVSKGREQVKHLPIDMSSLLKKVESFAQVNIKDRVELVFSIPKDLPILVGDPGAILSSLINLISNSSDALSNSGGIIHVCVDSTSSNEDLRQNLPIVASGEFLKLEVMDNGVGISPEILGRVRESFFTTKGPGQGTGLGLAIVHKTIEKLGGRVGIESIPDLGTKVTLWIPIEAIGRGA